MRPVHIGGDVPCAKSMWIVSFAAFVGLLTANAGCSLLFNAAEVTEDKGSNDGGVADAGMGEDCGDSTCPINGFCVTAGGSEVCQCLAGFEGPDCENIDDCRPYSCANDGVCVDGVESVTCECTGNWTGARCDQELCPSTTLQFSTILSGCQSSPLETPDVTISSSGMLCVSSALGVGSDGVLGENENLSFSFSQPIFLEVSIQTTQGIGEIHALGKRMNIDVYDSTWSTPDTLRRIWPDTNGETVDTLVLSAQNNGGRSFSKITFWSHCQPD